MFVYSYLQSAISIIDQYNGEVPLALHLKTYFKLNKKYGGRDRKQISHFCYCYYRTGHLFIKTTIEEKIKKSFFICSNTSSAFLEQVDKTYNEKAHFTLQEKLNWLGVHTVNEIYPQHSYLSDLLPKNEFITKQIKQPFLYLRIRPKSLADVLIRLNKLDIEHTVIDPYTVQLPNGFAAAKHFVLDKEVVVQDYSSQQVMDALLPYLSEKQTYKVWDCCAASGGKSILLYDLCQSQLNIFVTDVRESILANLNQRFLAARIMNYKSKVHNVARAPLPEGEKFDIIICDVPCSGSGTWRRTPEQGFYFRKKQLDEFVHLQQNIVCNASQNLRSGGYLLYITCSAFAAENEIQMEQLLAKNINLTVLRQQYIHGFEHGADTMFVCLLKSAI